MKKFLALILAVLMIAGSAVSVAAFDDVSGKYADAINGLQATGIVAGTSETTFTPDALVTRWQMALFMARAASAVTDDADWAEGAKIFTDCTQYLGAIQYCFGRGIIKGVTTTEFAPDNNILFRDGIIMAIRALGYEKEDEGLEASAKKYNKTGAAYWTPYYERAIELGLLENLGNVAVDKALTRAETAQLIYNMLYTPVYAKDGANENNYTLYDVAFGGKAIVKVENSMKAWVAETPGYFFDANTLDADDEMIVINWNKADGTTGEDDVTFDELAKWGVDVENIDEYFGASLEIINYNKDDVTEYEYLANFEKVAPKVLTNEDVKITLRSNETAETVKIGTKTHYDYDAEPAKTKDLIDLYIVEEKSDDLDKITYTALNFAKKEDVAKINGKYYDLVVYDVDGDNYFEYGYVNLYKMDVYKEANTKGVEQCGDMAGLTEVVYSETLTEGDTFVYTFDIATKTVSVKEIVKVATGKITGYSEKMVDNSKVAYVTIGGTKYTINSADTSKPITFNNKTVNSKIVTATPAGLMEDAVKYMTKTYEYYTLGGKLLAFEKEIAEEAAEEKYLVLKGFTDFELYDHVVMTAFIDGEDKEIKVQKITRGGKLDKLNTMTFVDLPGALLNLFGIYTYTVDADGYYTLEQKSFDYNVKDFVKDIATDKAIKFNKGVQTNMYTVLDTANIAVDEGLESPRNKMLRIDANTAIYLIDMNAKEITTVAANVSGVFEIPVAQTATFYADKIGYGDVSNWTTGVASVIYIENTGAKDFIDVANYKLIFVQEDVKNLELGTADGFGINDNDETKDLAYVKYDVSGKAFVLSNFEDVNTVYKAGNTTDALAPGAYVIDLEGKIVGDKTVTLTEIKDAVAGTDFKITVTDTALERTAEFHFVATEINSGKIDLINYNDIRINDAKGIPFTTANGVTANNLTANITTLKFMDFTIDDETKEIETNNIYEAKVGDKNSVLIKHMAEYDKAETPKAVKVIIASNKANAALDYKTAVPGKTLCAVIVNNIGNPANPV